MNIRTSLSSRVFVNGALALTAIYFLFPVWWLIVSSTKTNAELFSTNGFWFATPNFLANVVEVFQYDGGHFATWLSNSFVYGVSAAVGAVLTSAAGGYVLAKFEIRGGRLIFGCVVAGLLIPATLLTVPLYLLASSVGMSNTMWAIIIPSIISPFGVYLCKVFGDTAVPDELLEAARIDGAGEFRIFVQIVFRLLSPALVTVGLFAFVGTWNNFMLPLVMLNDQDLYPVSLGIYSWQADKLQASYNVVLAGSVLMIIPLVIGFLALQRFWRTGLAMGSVKG